MQKSLLIIDGFNLLSRSYFATSYNRPIESLEKNEDGVAVNGMNGFLRKLEQLKRQYNVTHCVVTWDIPREDTFRRHLYEPYKQTRNELPEPLIEQYELLKQHLSHANVAQIAHPPYEADDLMGAISQNWETVYPKSPAYIYSNDKDLFQLLSAQTSQILSVKKKEIIMGATQFMEAYQIRPDQWVDVKALLGDPSDNIPGCPGVGEKTALPLIQMYTSIDSLYDQLDRLDPRFNRVKKKLVAGKELTYLSKTLSEIECTIDGLPDVSTFERSSTHTA
ncbi:5'-3' exonuclease [Bacillus sp. Marseille-P3800]|nr:5'-3' exonuclease [Bacillus sp. Marseille-P3800]